MIIESFTTLYKHFVEYILPHLWSNYQSLITTLNIHFTHVRLLLLCAHCLGTHQPMHVVIHTANRSSQLLPFSLQFGPCNISWANSITVHTCGHYIMQPTERCSGTGNTNHSGLKWHRKEVHRLELLAVFI